MHFQESMEHWDHVQQVYAMFTAHGYHKTRFQDSVP